MIVRWRTDVRGFKAWEIGRLRAGRLMDKRLRADECGPKFVGIASASYH